MHLKYYSENKSVSFARLPKLCRTQKRSPESEFDNNDYKVYKRLRGSTKKNLWQEGRGRIWKEENF
jgi:hypothetical protein